ncbi:MAG: hypothetical protein JWM57_151 [Phycisphaerales bacterium]|nr:hypothetical protein [Phycisphaerales bacterium]
MPEILILTGNCGVGKSTIAQAWADARAGAAVAADDIHLWIRQRSIRRSRGFQEELKANVFLAAARNLLHQGLSVAADNVWLPPSLDRFWQELSPLASVRVVRLTCRRDINHVRDDTRSPGARMGDRVDELGAILDAVTWPSFVTTIDTSDETVVETLARIDAMPPVARSEPA